MKRISNPILKIASIFVLFSFLSCFGEDEGDVDTCSYDYELDYYYDMINAYSNNPTVGTCNNLRDAALDLLDALEGCSDYDYYYDATQAWLDLDCSGLDGGNGGGGGGTGGGGTGGGGGGTGGGGTGGGGTGGGGDGSGKATFWTQYDYGCGNITVYISNYSGTISGYYSQGNPGCDAGSSANFNLPAGSYQWTASCSEYNWSGTITINEGNCSTMQLTL